MTPRDLVYVAHMLDTARKAVSKTQGISRESYDADENLRLALTHLTVRIIGEAGRKVSPEFCSGHPAESRGLTSSACATRSCTIISASTKASSGD